MKGAVLYLVAGPHSLHEPEDLYNFSTLAVNCKAVLRNHTQKKKEQNWKTLR
jgi:hypothetical protein